ncbi:MAG TPA: bifunctional hydroxymethylpyrimidine kinase/phosphomethylpyrimidine kinase [Polyangiaceae bacterium]
MSSMPCALAISGLDPSGGAGVYADLRAFRAASVWGCGAVAVWTVQSTAGLRSSRPVPTGHLLAQIDELFSHQRIESIKIGALGSRANVRGVNRWLGTISPRLPVVLDPVMRPSRGNRARLLADSAAHSLLEMIERVTVITPNVPEAEVLLGGRIRSLEEADRAARAFVGLGARAALVKGGHLPRRGADQGTTDVLAIGGRIYHLRGRRVHAAVHGTGCTLASLIAGRLAATRSDGEAAILEAVRWAKRVLQKALLHPADVGAGLSVMPL